MHYHKTKFILFNSDAYFTIARKVNGRSASFLNPKINYKPFSAYNYSFQLAFVNVYLIIYILFG